MTATRPAADPLRPAGGRHDVRWRFFGRALDPVRWNETHRRLAEQPAMGECTRAQIRHLVRVGDECFVPAGTVLCEEGRVGCWFFVVLAGRIRVSSRGRADTTVTAGAHFGEVAIVGFGPQPMTATAVDDCAVYVLGRRHVLDLTHTMDGLRHGLFPGVADADFQQKVRQLRSQAEEEWRCMPRRPPRNASHGELLPEAVRVFPSRRRLAPGSPLECLAHRAESLRPASSVRARPLSRRVLASFAGTAAAAFVAVGLLFHPGVLVVRPNASLDVTDDVAVEGLPVRPASGRYILTSVSISEPNLFGVLRAFVAGDETLRAPPVDDAPEQRAVAHGDYLESQHAAARLIAGRAGVDPAGVTVRFRDRGLSGASAGLVYALLLADITGQIEVPRDRVIAATGVVDDTGRILPVGFVAIKCEVAERAGADVFVVPRAQAPTKSAAAVVDVDTFDDAARAVTAQDDP